MKRITVVLVIAVVISSLLLAGSLLMTTAHKTEGSQSVVIILDVPYETAKKIMVRSNALEQIVCQQHGNVVNHRWDKLDLSSERLLSGWEVHGKASFEVETEDPEMGHVRLQFAQSASVGVASFKCETNLVRPVRHLKGLQTTLSMQPLGDKTQLVTTSWIAYRRRIPIHMKQDVDARVQAAANRLAVRNSEAVVDLVEKYGDKNIIIPIKK